MPDIARQFIAVALLTASAIGTIGAISQRDANKGVQASATPSSMHMKAPSPR